MLFVKALKNKTGPSRHSDLGKLNLMGSFKSLITLKLLHNVLNGEL